MQVDRRRGEPTRGLTPDAVSPDAVDFSFHSRIMSGIYGPGRYPLACGASCHSGYWRRLWILDRHSGEAAGVARAESQADGHDPAVSGRRVLDRWHLYRYYAERRPHYA